MSLVTPVLTYKSIKLNNVDITLSSQPSDVLVSYQPPFNRIDVVFRAGTSLSYYEVRTTEFSAEYGVGIGICAYHDANIAANADYSYSIYINSDYFPRIIGDGNKQFRVSLYAKNSVDGSWDATYLLFDRNGLRVVPTNADGIETLTIEPQPVNSDGHVHDEN